MNPNLVPQPRADKTGKVVIRHVRPDVPESSTGTSIPAPSIQSATKRTEQLLQEPLGQVARRRLIGLMMGNQGDKTWEGWIQNLPEEVVDNALSIMEKYLDNPRVASSVARSLRTWYKKNIRLTMESLAFAPIEEHFSDAAHGKSPSSGLDVASISFVVPDRQWDYELSETELAQSVAVAHAVAAIEVWSMYHDTSQYRGIRAQFIDDHPELLREVVDNYERQEQMTAFIKQRGVDPGLLREFLSADYGALSDGVL